MIELLTLEDLIAQILNLSNLSATRIIVGISGVPGVGKSTLASRLVAALNGYELNIATYLPMDGFHKTNQLLIQENKLEQKGAIDTFDVQGYLNLLKNLKSNISLKAPEYCRKLHDVVPNSIEINQQRIIITEGIFLLAAQGAWSRVREYLDYCYFLEEEDEVIKQRLIQRQINKGRTLAQAHQHFDRVDGPNIQLVRTFTNRANAVMLFKTA